MKGKHTELAAITFGQLQHHAEGQSQVLDILYQQIQQKKEVGTGAQTDPYKDNCSGQTNLPKSMKFCVYYCKDHV